MLIQRSHRNSPPVHPQKSSFKLFNNKAQTTTTTTTTTTIHYPPSESNANIPDAGTTTTTTTTTITTTLPPINCFAPLFWIFTTHTTTSSNFITSSTASTTTRTSYYSNILQFSTPPINFANTDKTHIFELPQPIHTVSNINEPPHDFSLLSDNSISEPLSSQFSSATPSQFANNPFNPPQGPISNIQRLLSQAHWNHSFNIVNPSPSFQGSLPLIFHGTPPIITLSSNSPTPDPDQHPHHCIGKQPGTKRTYPTLPHKFDPKFLVHALALFGDHNNGEQLHYWAKQRITIS